MRYPHTLWVLQLPISVPDASGNYQPGSSSWEMVSVCRAEVANGGSVLTLEDGQTVAYTTLIHVPLSCPNIQSGAAIEVRQPGVGRKLAGTAQRFARTQLHGQLWV